MILGYLPKSLAPERKAGKTALVAGSKHIYGLSRMYKSIADISGQKVDINIFESLDEAHKWINQALI